MSTANVRAIHYERADNDGVGVVWIDVPGKKVNTLSLALMPELERVFAEAAADSNLSALVIASAKAAGFIAGADIDDLNDVKTTERAVELSRDGQAAMARLADFGKPTVAAIHGDCLGGGLELALACTARIASASAKTKLALPEVMLGLLPGAGGTVRLPQLVGLQAALDMMLTGKNIRADKALKMGLVDRVVPASQLVDAARAFAKSLAAGAPARTKKKQTLQQATMEAMLEHNPVGRRVVLKQARKMVMSKTGGLYPAPLKILEVVAEGSFVAEAAGFGALLMTPESKGLRHLFHCITTLKKQNGPGTEGVAARDVTRVGMLGAGLMGAGIATVLADNGVSVRLKDLQHESIGKALDYARAVYGKAVKRKRYNKAGQLQRMGLLSGGVDFAGFANCEVVIEAVLEKLPLKQAMVAEIEQRTHKDAIFATNTSAIPITDIAAKAAHPERVIGMHFFSPVEKMPLVEVIVTAKTDPVVTATTVALARTMGKHVIVVRDCPGFYTTRVLAPYMIEATFAAIEGNPVDAIDEAAIRVGFPVGPITLMDEVGIDVGQKVLETMKHAYSGHMDFPPNDIDRFVTDGRLGRKASRGFYVYEKGRSKTVKGKKVVDDAIYDHLPKGRSLLAPNHDEIGERLLLALVNEAVRCHGEGILLDAESGDLGAASASRRFRVARSAMSTALALPTSSLGCGRSSCAMAADLRRARRW
jgi:3-hydroxyacyl-CoA dehydrogenase / enoyl-CoA hydratase / 3-hydroxybutyryl-CoA epimerase